MVLFLHQVRVMQVNGFSLWSNSKFVVLGRPLSDSCVNTIGETIFDYHLNVRRKGFLRGHSISEVVDMIDKHAECSSLMSKCPAVLNEIISQIRSPDFYQAVQLAIDKLVKKVELETIADMGNFFSEMRDNVEVLAIFHQFAVGKGTNRALGPSIPQFISLLCGQDPDSTPSNMSNLQLLRPYSTVIRNFLTETGEFTVDMEHFSRTRVMRPSAYFQDVVTFFWEYSHLLPPELLKEISQAVMKRAAEMGIGVQQAGSPLVKEITDMSEYFSCPQTRNLRFFLFRRYTSSLKKPPCDEVEREELTQKHIQKMILSNKEPVIVLSGDFRHLDAHLRLELNSTLIRVGWNLCDAHALMLVAGSVLMRKKPDWVVEGPNGAPCPNEKYLKENSIQSAQTPQSP